MIKLNPKLKNPVFIAGVISLIFAAAGINFNTLTDWNTLWVAVLSIFRNPVALVAIAVNLYSAWNNNDTPHFDNINLTEKEPKNLNE